jgi:hypothetical protein
VEPLEDRCLLSAAITISDTSAIEGATAAKLLDRFVAAGSGGLSRPTGLVFGPDGNHDGAQDLYVADKDLNAVLRYDGITGAFLDTFVASGSGGLNGPQDVAFGPDGNLYVSSNIGDQILRYDGSTGAFLDVIDSGVAGAGLTFGPDGSLYFASHDSNEVLRYNGSGVSVFVSAGSGGLSGPGGVEFGPDGNLYVGSNNTGQILRYNGGTGACIGVFTNQVSGQGGLLRLGFGTDGYLYTTARTTATTLNTSLNRFNATTGAYVDTLSIGRDSWSFMVDSNNVIYYAGNGGANYIERYGHSSLAAFSVTLDAASASPVTVNYATADGTAVAGTNYTAASGTVTIPAGLTSQTILIQTLDDGVVAANKTFTVNLSNPVGGTIARGQGTDTTIEGDSTKFYVVDDAATDRNYRYSLTGNAFTSSTLGSGDTAPRGVAANAAGTTIWAVDNNKTVYVYNPTGSLLGSWTAGGLGSSATLTGIATDGTNIWVVDSHADKVYKFTGAASRLSGNQNAASSFSLASGKNGDPNPQDIVTDGTSFWVVDGTALKVFKYTLAGSLLGSWSIDLADTHPTGITINPNNVSDIWIVDNGTDTVYQYLGAASRTSGSQNAGATFALAAGNTNPQGIADPPTADMLLTPAASPLAQNQQSVTAVAPSLANRDAAFAQRVGESLPNSGDFPAGRAITTLLDHPNPVTDLLWTTAGAFGRPNPPDTLTLLTPVSSPGVHSDGSAIGLQEGTLAGADREESAAVAEFDSAGMANEAAEE